MRKNTFTTMLGVYLLVYSIEMQTSKINPALGQIYLILAAVGIGFFIQAPVNTLRQYLGILAATLLAASDASFYLAQITSFYMDPSAMQLVTAFELLFVLGVLIWPENKKKEVVSNPTENSE